MKAYSTLVLSFLMYVSLHVHAQPGALDPSFGNGNGFVTSNFVPDQRSEGNGIAVHGNRITVAGYTRSPNNTFHAVLSVYSEDGTPDNSFNASGRFIVGTEQSSSGREIAFQPDGKILMAVTQSNGSDIVEGQIYRFNTNGSPDIDFGDQGIASTSFQARYLSAEAFVLQSDGKILMGGYVGYDQDTFDRFFVVRFLPDGTPDPTFDGDGAVITAVGESWTHVSALLIQPDHKIIAVGDAIFNQNEDITVVRYLSNGALDTYFGEGGIAHMTLSSGDDRACGATLQPDGKIVVGGFAFSHIVNEYQFAAARFNANGTPDGTFHATGYNIIPISGYSDEGRAMVMQPDGKILIAGYAHSDAAGGADMTIVRLNTNGIPDTDFDEDGIAIYPDNNDQNSSTLWDIALQPDGKAVVSGYQRVNGLDNLLVGRVLTGLTVATKEIKPVANHVQLYPNPVQDHVSIEYTLDWDELLHIELYDVEGRWIRTLMPTTERNAGDHHDHFYIQSGLIPGTYFVNLETASGKQSFRIVLQ